MGARLGRGTQLQGGAGLNTPGSQSRSSGSTRHETDPFKIRPIIEHLQ